MTRTWHAEMISPNGLFDGAPLLRREIELEQQHGAVRSATLYASGLGVFTAYLAGAPVSDDVLSPGWSSYEWRVRYREYDVTSAVTAERPVVLGMALGNGWYAGRLGFMGNRGVYGQELGAIAELVIVYADGHRQLIGTDGTWTAGPSAVTSNDLYDGQAIDARLLDPAWLRPGATLPGWTGVHRLTDFDLQRLTPYLGPPVRRQETVAAQRIWTAPSGRTVVDFGQNLVGWIRLRATGQPGETITVRHAEVMEHDELGVRPLRTAQATDRFILSGGMDDFEPTLTFHGFRYVDLDGYPGDLSGTDIEAVVVHSELRRLGTFECSDPMLNRLHDNVVWSLRGNFLDVPTDCPQRDERLGWTGDLAVFAPTAAFLFDVSGFLDDWMADLAAEQAHAGGRVPFVIPDNLKYDPLPEVFPEPESPAVWADAAVWVPWALWEAYGDVDALRRHYPAMVGHVRHVETLLSPTGLWDQGFQFGDWLDPTAPPEDPLAAAADKGVVATASFHRTLSFAVAAARQLGHQEDELAFEALRMRVKSAFTEHYVDGEGIIVSDCPTVYALAIAFDLLEVQAEASAGRRLAELVEKAGFTITTGFAGTPYILGALTRTGRLDTAYRLLLERSCPSWLYPVTMGATTIWERWDSMLPDGSINPGEMTSFNHYALGAVADWMHQVVGGISPLDPGFSRVLLSPRPGGEITWARTSFDSPHGLIKLDWEATPGGRLTNIDVELPTGVSALLNLPGGADRELSAGRHQIRDF